MLQEGGVDCYYWFVILGGYVGGEGDCVLFGDCYVEIVLWVFFVEVYQVGVFVYCWCDVVEVWFGGGGIVQLVVEYIGIGWFFGFGFGYQVFVWIEWVYGVVIDLIVFCWFVVFVFGGYYMQQFWVFGGVQCFQGG